MFHVAKSTKMQNPELENVIQSYQLSNVVKQYLHFLSVFNEHDFIFTLQGEQTMQFW